MAQGSVLLPGFAAEDAAGRELARCGEGKRLVCEGVAAFGEGGDFALAGVGGEGKFQQADHDPVQGEHQTEPVHGKVAVLKVQGVGGARLPED